jgi:hypothetical protein
VATGASKTAVITLLIETITKTAAGYEPPMAHRISRVYAALAKAYRVEQNYRGCPISRSCIIPVCDVIDDLYGLVHFEELEHLSK